MAARKKGAQSALSLEDDDTEETPQKESNVEKVLSKEREDAEEKEDDPVIRLDAEDEDDDPEPQISRDEKKRRRGSLIAEAEANKARAEAAERFLQQTMEMQRQYAQPQQQPQDELAPYEQQLERERTMLLKEAEYLRSKGGGTESEVKDYTARVQEHNNRDAELKVARALQKMGVSPQQRTNPVVEEARRRYPDVAVDDKASNWATARFQQLVLEGKPNDWPTLDIAVSEARQRFGIGRPGPSSNMKTRLAGHSRGGGSSGGASFVMTKQHRKQADALYSHIKDTNKRYTMYAQTVGRKILSGGVDDE